jgi:hypothetical protein
VIDWVVDAVAGWRGWGRGAWLDGCDLLGLVDMGSFGVGPAWCFDTCPDGAIIEWVDSHLRVTRIQVASSSISVPSSTPSKRNNSTFENHTHMICCPCPLFGPGGLGMGFTSLFYVPNVLSLLQQANDSRGIAQARKQT